MLTSVLEELPDVPLFHQLAHMCSVLHVPTPTLLAVVSALMRQGYRVSRSHTDASAIKTDAPNGVLWDVLRCWVSKYKPNPNPNPNGVLWDVLRCWASSQRLTQRICIRPCACIEFTS